ncbi:MAG: hypothetical protein WCS70_15325 [Verrucomicrobiota bacterium]
MMYCLLFLVLTGAAVAEDFSRYQIVIDRSPFGPVTGPGPTEAAPGFSQRYQFVALVNSNGGQGVLQAIIFDKEANRSYFRAQGDSLDNNVKVERIDLEPPKLVLKSGLETAQLTFQARAAGPAPVAIARPGMPPQAEAQPVPLPGQPNVIRRIPFRRGN